MTTLPITLLTDTAIAPEYATDGSAGADLRADESVWLSPGEWRLIHTGVAAAIPEGHVGDVRSRSGLGSVGIVVGQGVGTIDADYRGEILVNLYNRTRMPYQVKAGRRIAQLVIQPVARAEITVVQELPPTERGAGGHGSTGV